MIKIKIFYFKKTEINNEEKIEENELNVFVHSY